MSAPPAPSSTSAPDVPPTRTTTDPKDPTVKTTPVEHSLSAPGLAEHLALTRPPKPEPRYGHEVAPMPDGWAYTDKWRHATDLPLEMARHHTAVAYGWVLAIEASTGDDDLLRAAKSLIPAYQLAWVWASLAKLPELLAATPKHEGTWILDLARDMATDLVSPQVFGPNLRRLLGVLGMDPAGIRAYGSEA